MTDSAFLFHCLEDGKWHGQAEIIQRSIAERGFGLTVHSRASDLRKKGCIVECELRRNGHGRTLSYYRLALDEPEAAIVGSGLVSGSSSAPAAASLPCAEPSTADESASPPVDPAGALHLFDFPVHRGAYGGEAA